MTDKTTPPTESLLTFPCDFTLKVFGLGTDEFEAEVLSLVHKQIPNFSERVIQSRASENGKYRALSITVHVQSKEQLDNLYRVLSTSPHILMVL